MTLTEPRPNFLHIAGAGLVGELSFEAYAWLVSPTLFGTPLSPSNLVIALTEKYTGLTLPHTVAFGLHFLVGSLVFGFLVWLTQRLTGLNHLIAGALTGLVLWFVAQGLLAPLIGRSFMMGFGPYTQSSFIGHVGMSVIIGAVLKFLTKRATRHHEPSP